MQRTIFLATGVLIFATACSKGDSPKAVASKFIAAMKGGDSKALEGLVTKDSLPLLSVASRATKFMPLGDAAFGAETISGDSATVDVKVGPVMVPWAFKKEDGKWKFNLKNSLSSALTGGIQEGVKKAIGAGLDKLRDLMRPRAPTPPPAEPARPVEPPRPADAPR